MNIIHMQAKIAGLAVQSRLRGTLRTAKFAVFATVPGSTPGMRIIVFDYHAHLPCGGIAFVHSDPLSLT